MRIAYNIYKDMGLHRTLNMLPLQIDTHIPTIITQKQVVVCRGFRHNEHTPSFP